MFQILVVLVHIFLILVCLHHLLFVRWLPSQLLFLLLVALANIGDGNCLR